MLFLFGKGNFNVKIKKDKLLALRRLQDLKTLLHVWGFSRFYSLLKGLGHLQEKWKKKCTLLMEGTQAPKRWHKEAY